MIHDIDDRQLSKIIKEQLPQAPTDQWFVKKTMNRLPERRKTVSSIETISYILSTLLITIGWIWQISSIHASKTITLENLIISISLFFSAIILTTSIVIPISKKC